MSDNKKEYINKIFEEIDGWAKDCPRYAVTSMKYYIETAYDQGFIDGQAAIDKPKPKADLFKIGDDFKNE